MIEPAEILERGLMLLNIETRKKSKAVQNECFAKHYGSSALVIASQWHDLCNLSLNEKLKMTAKEKRRGLKMFFVAHFFLWTYPKNAHVLASRCGICERYARGAYLWIWVERIAILADKVIRWPTALDSRTLHAEILAFSIDGTDKKTWERKHPTLPYDKKNYTQKHAHGGLKYQVTICTQRARVVHIFGPVRGGMSDKEMLIRSEILNRLNGKLVIVDRGYIAEKMRHQLSWPNSHDDPATNNFKSRCRLRHETFNGRMCFFSTMNQTWRHTIDQNGFAFRAVAAIVQYQMDNGSPIFTA
jgi:hypothetical protein